VFKYGAKSKKELSSAHEDLQEIFNEAIKYMDLTIIEGKRSKERQAELYEQGATKTLDGKHCEGLAVDVAPYPIDWENRENFIYMGGFIMGIAKMMNIPLRWGGDWNSNNDLSDNNFDDLVHFELDY
jgi:peptidoglycan L-alanyl-D-glutamate endopeptidase CwlK